MHIEETYNKMQTLIQMRRVAKGTDYRLADLVKVESTLQRGQCVRPGALSDTMSAQQAQGEELCLHPWRTGCIQRRTTLYTLSPSWQLHSRPQLGLGNSSWRNRACAGHARAAPTAGHGCSASAPGRGYCTPLLRCTPGLRTP